MRKFIIVWLVALIGIGAADLFAQSRRVTPASDDGAKKANKREVKPAPEPGRAPSTAQAATDESAEVDDQDVITVETDLVTVPVKVLDRKGRFVGGLTKENFKVFENDVEQEVAFFSDERHPFTVALVLDMSYSAKFKAEEIQSAALAFISQLRENDRVMVVSFDEQIYVHCEPTNNRAVLQRAIKSTKISFGTSLYDAVNLVINQKLRKITGRKAIVLFTDGVDTTSREAHSMRNLGDALELDALIFPIRYDTYHEVQAMKNKSVIVQQPVPNPIPSKNKSPLPFPIPTSTIGTPDSRGTTLEEYQQGEEYLNEMANRTGGRVYQASTIANLTDAFSKIASELREFYSLGYYPAEESKNNRKNKIKVRVDQPEAVVKARDSYVGGKKTNN